MITSRSLSNLLSLKDHLLTGASAAAIVVAAGVVLAPEKAMAQATEINAGNTLQTFTSGGAGDAEIAAGFDSDANAGPYRITIDINDTNDTTVEFTNDTAGQEFRIYILDNGTTNPGNTLTLTGDATVDGAGASLQIYVGDQSADDSTLIINGDVVERNGGQILIGLASDPGVSTATLVFDADGRANQVVDAIILSALDNDDDVSVIIANSNGGAAGTTTFTDAITLRTGDFITVGGAAAEATTAIFQANVTAPGGLNVNSANAAAALVLGAEGATTTITANIDSVAGAASSLAISDGATVTLIGGISSTTNWVTPIAIGGGAATMLTLQGNTDVGSDVRLSDNASLVVDSTGLARTLSGTVAASAADLSTTLRTTGGNLVTFDANVGVASQISTLDVDTATVFNANTSFGTVDVASGVTATMNGGTNAITGNITGDGTLFVGDDGADTLNIGVNGTASTVSIANLDGGAGPGNLNIVAGSMVTITTIIGDGAAIGNFSTDVGGAGTDLTINSGTSATGETSVVGSGVLSFGDGTIVLGDTIGAGDTVFSFTSDNGLVTTAGETTMIQLAASFTAGQIIFADTAFNQTAAHDGVIGDGEIAVINTALTSYSLGDGGDNTEIAITATAATTAQAAATLGVSTGQAEALRQAVTSATASGDTAGLAALTTALNAGGAQATQAAQQIGPQDEVVDGAAQTAFDMTSQQQNITGDRLASFRSGDARFVSAFAAAGGETGFSGGDLDAPYAPLAPRYTNSVWFQAFGGVANVDGDTLNAGYDSGFGGAMIGIDGALTENVTIGAFGSYSFSTVDGDGAGNAQLDANTYQIGFYGSYTSASFYLDAFASYAGSDNDISRTALAQTITASYDASQFAVGLAGGVPIEVSSNVFITPNASLTYNHYDADSYTETGSAGLSARVNPGSASQLTGTLSARIHAVYEQSNGTSFIPELRLGIIGDLIDDDAVSTATFVGGGTAFNVTGTDTDDIGALIGIGFALDNATWSAGVSYDADIRSDYMSHTGRAEFRWKF